MRAVWLICCLLGFGCGALAIPFVMVFASGFVGTSGREAGGELLVVLGVALAGLAIGWWSLRAYKGAG